MNVLVEYGGKYVLPGRVRGEYVRPGRVQGGSMYVMAEYE